MSAATISRFGDLDSYRRLSALVAELEDLAQQVEGGDALASRLGVLEDATIALIEDVQARLPWVVTYQARWHPPRGQRRPRPAAAVTGNWGRTRTRADARRRASGTSGQW